MTLPASPAEVRAAHRAAAGLTRLDVDALDALAAVLRAAQRATTDHDLDRAAAGLAVLMSVLPIAHPLLVAARAGLEVGDSRRTHRLDLAQASHAIAAGMPGGWADRHVPYGEAARRRAQPGPLAGGTAA